MQHSLIQKRYHGKILTVSNNKGGVKKTTTALNLGYGLSARGYRVLIVDADSQCNTTYTLLGDVPGSSETLDIVSFSQEFHSFDEEYQWDEIPEYIPPSLQGEQQDTQNYPEIPGENQPSIYDILFPPTEANGKKRRIPTEQAIISIPQQENLYLIKGSIQMSDMDIMLASEQNRHKPLSKALEQIRYDFDFILIDTPPIYSLNVVNAYFAAGQEADYHKNGIIISISPQSYSVLGIRTLIETIQELRESLEIPLPIFGVVCSDMQRTKNARNQIAMVVSVFGKAILPPVIPRNEKIEEVSNLQIPLEVYAPKSTGAIAYQKLVDSVLRRAELPLSKGELKEEGATKA